MPLRILFLYIFLFASAIAKAAPQLHKLDIRVVLRHNADALITERRDMTIDDYGTECYIGLGYMSPSTVRDLRVTDENGQEYTNVGEWDVNRSREWKTCKCGIVNKSNGYELCWGLGASGERTYITEYVVTGLVRAHPDADAIRHVFMDPSVSPKPEKATVTIESEDSVMFTTENSGAWGFRFAGGMVFSEGKIVATNTYAFGQEDGLYIMVRFDKGIFEPTIKDNDTFEHKKEQAFEGSDYAEDFSEWTIEDWLGVIFVIIIFSYGILELLWGGISIWMARRKAFKNLMWYRDIPLGGDLQEANNILNAYRYSRNNYNNLLSACILRLISMGSIAIEQRRNNVGEKIPKFVIRPLQNADETPLLLRKVHEIFRNAAGSDTILEPSELREYTESKYNAGIMESFAGLLHSSSPTVSKYKDRQTDVRQVFGLKKFLKEFSLLNERGINEVALWKEYMIYATLFGIADKVIDEMRKINPEYFNMDAVASQMADKITISAIHSTFSSGAARAAARKASREAAARARSSGHGGHTSRRGGGGGFSGRHSGGGVR